MVLGFVALASSALLRAKNFVSYQFFGFVRPALASIGSLLSDPKDVQLSTALMEENARLKAELLALSKNPYAKQTNEHKYLVAKIYSVYPFNNRGLVTINAGSEDGLELAQAVAAEGYLFFGQVVEVHDGWSLVRTIFDPGWEMPVKIQDDSIDALLRGGRRPELTLIGKDNKISEGQTVYVAGKGMPYGVKVGELTAPVNNIGNAFQNADLLLAYDPGNLNEVSVIIK